MQEGKEQRVFKILKKKKKSGVGGPALPDVKFIVKLWSPGQAGAGPGLCPNRWKSPQTDVCSSPHPFLGTERAWWRRGEGLEVRERGVWSVTGSCFCELYQVTFPTCEGSRRTQEARGSLSGCGFSRTAVAVRCRQKPRTQVGRTPDKLLMLLPFVLLKVSSKQSADEPPESAGVSR